ncbi:MAG: hypothetical protein BGO39_07730 [Chloroflexi bacterium 54-19]|nr:MAG: hypothetical protein BGO39_07730 [Chloroflexi bacterium 54-19]
MALLGGLVLLVWGCYMALGTLFVPGMRGASGLIGPYAGVFGGAILILAGLLALFAGWLVIKHSTIGFGLLLPICLLMLFVIPLTFSSAWFLVSYPLAFIVFAGCFLAFKGQS